MPNKIKQGKLPAGVFFGGRQGELPEGTFH